MKLPVASGTLAARNAGADPKLQTFWLFLAHFSLRTVSDFAVDSDIPSGKLT